MKFAAVLSFVSVALASVAIEKRACSGNNCNRAVTGTRDGLPAASIRSSDCASYLATTVTPEAVTVTVTVDEEDITATIKKRDATTAIPTAIPTYASACTSVNAYASACSCYGVTGTVVTAATPTVTATTTLDFCDE